MKKSDIYVEAAKLADSDVAQFSCIAVSMAADNAGEENCMFELRFKLREEYQRRIMTDRAATELWTLSTYERKNVRVLCLLLMAAMVEGEEIK